MSKELVRRVLLVSVSILNWIFSVGYIREIYDLMSGENLIAYSDDINIDGSDFTPLANLAVAGVNGLTIFLSIGLSWQQPLFMMLIYYLPLKKQFKNGTI